MKIQVTIPEEDEDNPGHLFDSRMDANGDTLRELDGRVHLYER